MIKPLLQVALDHTDLQSALVSAELLAPEVDVLEAGTILCYSEGLRAVEALRKKYRKHIILADLKVADAGAVVAQQVFNLGATWMTVICNAPLATMEAALKVARDKDGDIQVELYGDWTFEHARKWKSAGLRQLVYHRGRDAAAAGQKWSDTDIGKIRNLVEMGFQVSVTGGLTPGDLPFFKGIPVKAFIAGRSLYGAANPVEAARKFHKAIDVFMK